MPAHDDCVLWTLETPSARRVVCYAVIGEEGLAITVEREGEIILAEMVDDIDAATARAEVVRQSLIAVGLTHPRR
jgi:hypothetical protein